MAHLYFNSLLRRSLYRWFVGVVSSSVVLADDGTGDLDIDAGRVAGICERGGRPRGLPLGLP